MVKALRQDMFSLPKGAGSSATYVILRKAPPTNESLFLEQVLISPSESSVSKRDHSFISRYLIDPDLYASVNDGDIGLFTGRGFLRVALTSRANHNTLLVTERCDNFCKFCSQPPKNRNDDWLLVQAAMALAAFNTSSQVGISGGEPLIYRSSFIRFLKFIAEHSPKTPLHILSNGRAFSDLDFTLDVAYQCQDKLHSFGIPLYSSVAESHDYLVGIRGAFRETIKGLINAGNSGIPIELRIIPTKYNLSDLEATVLLVSRCLSNLSQISIMNLEPTGWAKQNWHDLYVEPVRYIRELASAIDAAERAHIPICLYNFPLCHLPTELHHYAVKSISDWKNYYPEECEGCRLRNQCGGYFVSSRGVFHQSARKVP
ncbi:His-Xaa-Ser system radical SAM maturase HxsC [Hahella sp. CR1]|uniref:His-Xaa-Ser system radical SAM maturase HxsC n=1 Tax=Hahella sp. CR1 TaxID=2992807 RepID=UPI002440F593|nr:His-Xaa-Ser system radical SAM maturase HxsC [Hahella sp. CR1]MDG9670544.1 His-Xaa-Ser system radical SAM maturase HxsC [Hahella sp. CR1]